MVDNTLDITSYLSNFINKHEDINKLLDLLILNSNSTSGSIFNLKKCISYSEINKSTINTALTTSLNNFQSKDVYIENNPSLIKYYKSEEKINNIIIIPITIKNESIGYLSLCNKKIPYTEKDIIPLTPYISLLQLILSKNNIKHKIKNIYSDSSYFSKDLFLANMSHEIRTPLNGIIGYNQLLMKTEINSIQRTYLNSMTHCSIQLMQIINDILDFSKLSSGKMNVRSECFPIKDILDALNDAIMHRIKSKKQKCKYIVDTNVPPYLILDKQKLIQIIVNLVSNANKFSPIGAEIIVNISNCANILKISVTDYGIGIADKDKDKIFNSFVQLQNLHTKTGTGLGLAISKKIVKLLKGEIYFESVLGKGSVFTFTCEHKPYGEYEQIIKRDAKLIKNKYILVVEDNPDNRIVISEILFSWEMKPIMCASAFEGLRMILGNRYNFECALIDICMPVISGIELAAQIKEEKPLFPLIAISSVDDLLDFSNFDDKLTKPLDKIQLFNCIHKIIYSRNGDIYLTNDSETSSNSPSNSPKSSFKKNVKILIAEDILYNQTLLVNILESIGYEDLETVGNGSDAIKLLGASPNTFDIVLLDLRMPNVDGYAVLEYLQTNTDIQPEIVIITASIMEEDRIKCKKYGVKYFINKPIKIEQLTNILLRICLE